MEHAVDPAASQELVLKGELLIQRVAELKEELQAALEKTDALMINLLEVTDIDLAGLQLLCAARHTAAAANRQLGLVAAPSPELERTLELAGLPGKGCREKCGPACLWTCET